MAEEIINRVANSALVTFDLEDYYPSGKRAMVDISQWLYEGIVLREKEFRAGISSHDWSQYEGAFVALHCSTDAIIPGWAYLLISTYLNPYARHVVVGDLETLESSLYRMILEEIDTTPFEGKPVILKGCSNKPVPANAYVWAAAKLQPVVRSLMYGEACSSVPLFKQKKS